MNFYSLLYTHNVLALSRKSFHATRHRNSGLEICCIAEVLAGTKPEFYLLKL